MAQTIPPARKAQLLRDGEYLIDTRDPEVSSLMGLDYRSIDYREGGDGIELRFDGEWFDFNGHSIHPDNARLVALAILQALGEPALIAEAA